MTNKKPYHDIGRTHKKTIKSMDDGIIQAEKEYLEAKNAVELLKISSKVIEILDNRDEMPNGDFQACLEAQVMIAYQLGKKDSKINGEVKTINLTELEVKRLVEALKQSAEWRLSLIEMLEVKLLSL